VEPPNTIPLQLDSVPLPLLLAHVRSRLNDLAGKGGPLSATNSRHVTLAQLSLAAVESFSKAR
jgi:hypothetical protein